MGEPLATTQISGVIHEATGDELIINRLGAIEDRKDPERLWGKINKYTAYALRGFGSFNVTFGRGMHGVELQTSLPRQSNTLKHRFWEL